MLYGFFSFNALGLEISSMLSPPTKLLELDLLQKVLVTQNRSPAGGQPLEAGRNVESIIVGYFNLHHPVWGGDHVKSDSMADELLAVIDEFRLTQHVALGTHTFLG